MNGQDRVREGGAGGGFAAGEQAAIREFREARAAWAAAQRPAVNVESLLDQVRSTVPQVEGSSPQAWLIRSLLERGHYQAARDMQAALGGGSGAPSGGGGR